MKLKTTVFLKLAVFIIGFVSLLLCVFWLPWLAERTAEMNPEVAHLRYPVLVGIYLTAIPFYLALYRALKLLNYIDTKNAFSELAVNTLRHIKNYAFVIAGLYVVGMFFLGFEKALHPGIGLLGLAIIFASVIIAFFAAVLQELLRSALEIKSENDLTV